MRRAPFHGLLVLWLVCTALPVAAHIDTLGEITKVGLWDDNPLHVALLMEGGGDVRPEMTLTSQDGGITWKISDAALPPEKMRPLPQEGQVQYRIAWFPESENVKPVNGSTLIRSTDGGQNWTDISPWKFLRGQLRDKIEKRKAKYLAQYGLWLPDNENWLLVFSVSASFLLLVGGWVVWRQKQAVLSLLLLSCICCLMGGAAFFSMHAFYLWLFEMEQWEGMLVWTSGWIDAPRWPLGLVMQLTGNVWLAPLAAMVCLCVSPLNFALATALPRWRKTLHVGGLAVAIVILLLVAGVIFYGREGAL